jgi:hypothetical protein
MRRSDESGAPPPFDRDRRDAIERPRERGASRWATRPFRAAGFWPLTPFRSNVLAFSACSASNSNRECGDPPQLDRKGRRDRVAGERRRAASEKLRRRHGRSCASKAKQACRAPQESHRATGARPFTPQGLLVRASESSRRACPMQDASMIVTPAIWRNPQCTPTSARSRVWDDGEALRHSLNVTRSDRIFRRADALAFPPRSFGRKRRKRP